MRADAVGAQHVAVVGWGLVGAGGPIQRDDLLHQIARRVRPAQQHHHAAAFLGDARQRAAQRPAEFRVAHAEHILQGVTQVHAHQCRGLRLNGAANQRQVHGLADAVFVDGQTKLTELGLHVLFGHALDAVLGREAVADQVGDGADLELVLARKGEQVGAAFHAAVVIDDFADDRGLRQTRQSRQIHRGLGVSSPGQHAAFGTAQRENMSRPRKVFGLYRRIGQRAYGLGAIVRGNAGGGAVFVIHRDGERGAVRLGVVRHHLRQPQVIQPLARHRHADDAAGVAHKKRDRFRRDLLGRHDQVALVLAILVVHQDHDLAGLDARDDVLDGVEFVAGGFE